MNQMIPFDLGQPTDGGNFCQRKSDEENIGMPFATIAPSHACGKGILNISLMISFNSSAFHTSFINLSEGRGKG